MNQASVNEAKEVQLGHFDPYQLDPKHILEPPTEMGAILGKIGPGIVLSASIVGSGELIATTTLGAEVGYLLTKNLWLAAGYNFFGFEDDDLVDGDYSDPGAYLRLRVKFDEDLFQWLQP